MAAKTSARSVAVASKPKASGSGTGDVQSVEFRPAKGGIISETRSTGKSGRSGLDPYSHKSETAIHPSLSHAIRHLKSTLGSTFAGPNDTD